MVIWGFDQSDAHVWNMYPWMGDYVRLSHKRSVELAEKLSNAYNFDLHTGEGVIDAQWVPNELLDVFNIIQECAKNKHDLSDFVEWGLAETNPDYLKIKTFLASLGYGNTIPYNSWINNDQLVWAIACSSLFYGKHIDMRNANVDVAGQLVWDIMYLIEVLDIDASTMNSNVRATVAGYWQAIHNLNGLGNNPSSTLH